MKGIGRTFNRLFENLYKAKKPIYETWRRFKTMEMIEFEGIYSEEDILRVRRLFQGFDNAARKRDLYFIAVLVLLSIIATVAINDPLLKILSGVFMAILAIGLFGVTIKLRSQRDEIDRLKVPIRGILSDAGIEFTFGNQRAVYEWGQVRRYSYTKKDLILHFSVKNNLAIPRTFFESDDSWLEAITITNKYLENIRLIGQRPLWRQIAFFLVITLLIIIWMVWSLVK